MKCDNRPNTHYEQTRPDAAFASSYFGGAEDDWDALHDGLPSNGSDAAWTNLLALCSQGLDQFEFLEFLNSGTNPIALTNLRLTNAIRFNFASNSISTLGLVRWRYW